MSLLNLELQYDPTNAEIEPVEIFGRTYFSTIKNPNVFVVKKEDYNKRMYCLIFKNENKIYTLNDCRYTENGDYLHIECTDWKIEYKD